ncbi:MAG: TlpA family protein disulfide reductase [Clostridia bacterium]|nr:TlpA family protein disulfide reductase [Clostridia bacterium]
MGKIKKALIGALLTCAAVCVSTAVTACNKNADYSKYPAYREPAGYVPPEGGGEQGDPEVYNGIYTVKINSMGGLKLNGVRVNALKNGAVVMSGISIDGIVEFSLDKGVYDIEIDESSLPDGYYLEVGKEYATEADKAVVEIGVPSQVISTTASSGTSYQVGDIMYDFAYNEVGGARRTLSGLFANTDIKAVVLNFFFTTCGPCQAEFPAIEGAYNAYKDKLAIVALSNQDNLNDIKNFKESRGLTFDMAYDSAGVTNMFGINNFPTTIIVDRYGAVAYRSMGTLPNEAVWKGLFNTYTSDDYVQKDKDDDEDLPTERVKPTEGLAMPASSEIENAINGTGTSGRLNNYRPETNENDAPYSWPWVLEEENGSKYLTASNSKKGYSFAIVYSTITLNSGEALSYEYNVDTETDCDFLYALLDGTIVGTHSGNSGGWQEAKAVYVADHTITLDLSFIYIKDQQKDKGADKASIRNITIRPITEIDLGKAIDQRTSVVDGLTVENGKYVKNGQNFEVGYLTKPTATDPYYYVTYKDPATGMDQKALLLADFNFSTLWAEKHLKSSKFTTESSSRTDATLYNLSFWRLSNYDRPHPETTPLLFQYGHSEYLIESYYLQDFSDNKLLPVNEERKAIIDDFIKEFYKTQQSLLKDGDTQYDDQWLEFCYYYMHFGGSHGNGEEDFCFKTDNPILGLTFENALTAKEGVNYANVRKMLNLNDGGGLKYIFKPTKTGIYLFSSEALEEAVDPRIIVMDENDRVLAEQDDDVRLEHFGASEFYKYVYLEAGKTYHVQAAMHYALATGKYNFTIEFTGKTYLQTLRTCSTAYGMWTYDPDNTSFEYYLAIPVALNGNYYYEVTADYNYGSPIYIDFLHVNYFDKNGHSLIEMIDNGIFNFGVVDYTAQMKKYYYDAIKNEGELYGLIKADKKLVDMLNMLIRTTHGNGAESNAWLMFAYYYESVGNPS